MTAMLLLAAASLLPAQDDTVLRAMRDELARARALRVVGDPPYFVEFTLDDADVFGVSAAFGALVNERHSRLRQPRVRIRVGDAKLDNTNHVGSDFYRGTRYDPGQFALDDNYDALRLGFWLATDRAYKQGLEALARKKASLKNITVTSDLPDFHAAPPVKMVLPTPRKPVDEALWRKRVRDVSALFAGYPDLFRAEVSAGVTQTSSYIVNSEGTEIRVPDNLVNVRLRAYGRAADGMVVRDAAEFLAFDAAGIPADEVLKKSARTLAENVKAMAAAQVIDNYSGPVLFEGVAAAQLMAELLARNLTVMRRPVSDPNRPVNLPAGELEGRIGSRILPEWMDAVDDPTRKEWLGHALFGYYPVDSEGVVPKPLTMIEKGLLKTYYSTRQPVQGVDAPNGHGRLPGGLGNLAALAGNLLVTTSQKSSEADLRKRLLDMGKQRSKPFVIVVRKLDFPSSSTLEDLRRITGGQTGRPVSAPLLIYRVFPDGKEELLRGVRFRALTVRTLKDIAAASDELHFLNYMENGGPFAHMDGGGYVAPTTVVSPSLLFEDVELERIPGELPKPPLVPPPPLVAGR